MQSLTMDPCHRRCFRRVVSVGLMVVVDKVFHLAAILFLTQSLCNVRSRISTSASAMISHTPVSRSPRIPFTMSDDFDTQCVFRDPLCDISPCKSWLASPSGFRSANRHRRQPHSADALISSIASVLSAIIGKASSIAAETDFLGHPSKPQFTKFLPGLEMRISHGV